MVSRYLLLVGQVVRGFQPTQLLIVSAKKKGRGFPPRPFFMHFSLRLFALHDLKRSFLSDPNAGLAHTKKMPQRLAGAFFILHLQDQAQASSVR